MTTLLIVFMDKIFAHPSINHRHMKETNLHVGGNSYK